MNKNKLYRFYGILLSDVLSLVDVPKENLHKRLKDSYGIESLKDLTGRELYDYIIWVQAEFASEYGLELPLRYHDMTLGEYLQDQNDEETWVNFFSKR